MAIKKYALAKEGPKEDSSKKRIDQLNEQIKQAQELLKQAKESDSKSERVFNLNTRVNNLKTQRDRLKHRSDEKKEQQKDEKAGFADLQWAQQEMKKLGCKPGKLNCYSAARKNVVPVLHWITREFHPNKGSNWWTHGTRPVNVTWFKDDNDTVTFHFSDAVKIAASKGCARHGKTDCESTMCPESPNFNILTTI